MVTFLLILKPAAGFSIKDNVPQMLKIMVEHLPARNFIGTSDLLFVDFKQLPVDLDSEEEDQWISWQLWCLPWPIIVQQSVAAGFFKP